MTRFRLLALLLLVSPVYADEPRADGRYSIYMGESGVIVLNFQITVGGNSPQQLFQQYVDDLMKSLDSNEDGVVTVEEARGKYLSVRDAIQAELIPQSEGFPPNMTPDVSPADGKISRQEFLTYFKRIGLHPFLVIYQARSMPATGNRRPRQLVNVSEIPLFARLDTNGDGKLSSAELTGALRTLRKLDLDDDETISAAELSPIGNANGVQQQQGNTQTASLSPFLGLGSEESPPKQIRRLIDRYDRIDGSNARNQKLCTKEMGLPETVFARFDGDGDGQLDFDELRQFLVSPEPTITITVNVDSAEAVKAESTQLEVQEKLKSTPDGSANINFGTTQLSISRGTSYDLTTAESLLKPQFMAADQDANGYLEKSEADQANLFGASFDDVDTDKNGKLYLDELIAYFKVRFDAARSRTVLTVTEQGRTLFEILDTDRDRRLSYRELQTAADKLALWDKDGDGLLSEPEVPMQYRLTISRGILPALGGNSGVNQTGALSERTSGPIWFRKMDKNRDGEVSQREFLGEIAEFEKRDRNHDGFIDLAEALQNTE